MARVLTFSRTFPAYHPRAGEPTWFVEKFWKSIVEPNQPYSFSASYLSPYEKEYEKHFPLKFVKQENIHNHEPKHHTIRAGSRWKAGDKFSPRVWSGRPGNSKQIIIAPDTEVVKVWSFKISSGNFYINDKLFHDWQKLSTNDGLPDIDDLCEWFRYKKSTGSHNHFEGQIICWSYSITY